MKRVNILEDATDLVVRMLFLEIHKRNGTPDLLQFFGFVSSEQIKKVTAT